MKIRDGCLFCEVSNLKILDIICVHKKLAFRKLSKQIPLIVSFYCSYRLKLFVNRSLVFYQIKSQLEEQLLVDVLRLEFSRFNFRIDVFQEVYQKSGGERILVFEEMILLKEFYNIFIRMGAVACINRCYHFLNNFTVQIYTNTLYVGGAIYQYLSFLFTICKEIGSCMHLI
jgi:hypothetical protein